MKSVLLCLCLLLSVAAGTNAQNTFPSAGAEWRYSGTSAFGNDGLYFLLHAKVAGDTLIDGHTCHIVRQDSREKRGSWQSGTLLWSPETQHNLRTFYVYNNDDTTFIYNGNFGKFTPLYIFNVTEGQTICLPVIADERGSSAAWPAPVPHPLTGDSSFCYIVDSVRMVLYDTTLLKTVYTRSVYDPYTNGPHRTNYPVQNWSYAGYRSVGAYAERIGGLRGGLLPKLIYFAELFDGIEPTQFLNLDCYSDNATSIKLSTKDCDYLPPTTLGLDGRNNKVFAGSVFPNPARDQITIRPEKPFGKDTRCALYDVTGRSVLEQLLPAGAVAAHVPLTGFKAGMYYLVLTTGGAKYYQKIIINP